MDMESPCMQEIMHTARIIQLHVRTVGRLMKTVAVRARYIPIWVIWGSIAVRPMAIVSRQLNKKGRKMREKKSNSNVAQQKRHRRRVWWWLFFVVLIVAGATAWVLYDGGIIGKRGAQNGGFVADAVVAAPVDTVASDADTENTIRPACAVVEDALLKQIVDDNVPDAVVQADSAHIYTVLAQYGCAENAQFFTDMAVRKQQIADGLEAAFSPNSNAMTSIEYLYSDEKVCETIEKRVLQNINTNAYLYDEFLDNANTYAALYEYGCRGNRAVYMRAALRELGVAVALMPTDKMNRDEIVTVVEICKSLGVAEAAHIVLQRLKARGYDMEFLLEMEDIIHGMR